MKSRRILIASNSPYTGKTFLGNLISNYVTGTNHYNFADPLKMEIAEYIQKDSHFVREIYSIFKTKEETETLFKFIKHKSVQESLDNMNSSDPSIKEQYRSLMQVWGTDFRRAQDSEYWTKKYKQFIDSSDDTDYITTDCRFENELELGTHSIFLYNPYTTTTYSHASESISGKNFDIEIVWYPEMSFGKVFNTFQYLLDHVYDQSYCDFNKLKEIYGRLKEAS